MNKLTGMKLIFESLNPFDPTGNTCLSVGTITLLRSEELHLDFALTETSMSPLPDSRIRFDVYLRDFEPQIFMEEYREHGIKISDLNYTNFLKHFSDFYLSEVYTEICELNEEIAVPLTLTNAFLLFENGKTLDYSSHITVFALNELAAVA